MYVLSYVFYKLWLSATDHYHLFSCHDTLRLYAALGRSPSPMGVRPFYILLLISNPNYLNTYLCWWLIRDSVSSWHLACISTYSVLSPNYCLYVKTWWIRPRTSLTTSLISSSSCQICGVTQLTNDEIINQTDENPSNISPARGTARHRRDRCPRERYPGGAVPRTSSSSFLLLNGS